MDRILATITAVLNSFQPATLFLQEMGTSTAHKTETRLEASGLLREVQEQSFLFIVEMLYKAYIAIKSFLLSQF